MNRRLFNILMIGAVAGLFAACNNDNILPDTPNTPTEGYHLTFDGGVGAETGTRAVWNDDNGSGNLIFRWDYTPDNATEYELKMAFAKEYSWLESEGEKYVTDVKILAHTDPDKAGNKHWAKFETIETYSSENYDGYRVFAVTPINDTYNSTMEVNGDGLIATLNMPATFTQVGNRNPEFLQNYMFMCGTAEMKNNSASIDFEHIPATFRFIITNKRPDDATIKSVKMSCDNDDGTRSYIGSTQLTLKARACDEMILKIYTSSCYAITTYITGDGAALASDATYIAYAMALPLGAGNEMYDYDAFNRNRKIKFTIEAGNPDNEYLSFVLDGSKIEEANRTLAGDGVYNWVGGKSYTIRMSLDDVLTFEGMTAEAWTTDDGGQLETE